MNEVVKTKTGRIEWIDIAKGISMLCIVAGHMWINVVKRVVFTFHVPIFFLISGYFLSLNMDMKTFVQKKAKALIIPYIFTSVILVLSRIPVDILKGQSEELVTDVTGMFVQALYGSGANSNPTLWGIGQIGAIWFLLALFWALIFAKLCINQKYGYLYIAIIAVVSYVSSKYVWLPWDIQAGGTAACYVYLGALFKKYKKTLEFKWWMMLIGALTLAVEFAFNIKVYMVSNNYKLLLVSAVGAVFISYFVFGVSKALERTGMIKKILCFYGTNSIIVLCFHMLELKIFPWGIMFQLLDGVPSIVECVVCFAIKILIITIGTMLVLKSRYLRKIFSR